MFKSYLRMKRATKCMESIVRNIFILVITTNFCVEGTFEVEKYAKLWSCDNIGIDTTFVFTILTTRSKSDCALKCRDTAVCIAFDACFIQTDTFYECRLRTVSIIMTCFVTSAEYCSHYVSITPAITTTLPTTTNLPTTTTLPITTTLPTTTALPTTTMNACNDHGTWDGVSCTCAVGCFGQYCNACNWKDCSDSFGQSGMGVAFITPHGMSSPIQVLCNFDYGVSYIQSRKNNDVSFNQTWEMYKLGFGTPDDSYWIGNEHLHAMTSYKSYIMNVRVLESGTWIYEVYNSFYVGNETSGYAITFLSDPDSGMSPSDSSKDLNGQSFRTFDRHDTNNCAATVGAGWWYNTGCAEGNANLPFPFDWYNKYYSITEIAIGIY